MRIVSAGAIALLLLLTSLASQPAFAVDTTAFAKACGGSEALGAMFAKAGDRMQGDRDALCKCIADAVAPKVTDDQLTLLAANVTGKMTDAQTDAYNKDEATQELAMGAMNGCLESTGVAKDYGG